MTELQKCMDCGLIWKYPGYPHYIGCPNCDFINQEPIGHEIEGDTSYRGMKRESPEWVYMVNKEAIERLRSENGVSKKLNEYRQEQKVGNAFERLKEWEEE